jgi:hypothetical protein
MPGDLLESGDIFFLFRPRVGDDRPVGLEDVQRFHVVLRPERSGLHRLLMVGRKRLPDMGGHERNWGFVDLVTDRSDEIERELREEIYQTKRRGERRRPAARSARVSMHAEIVRGRRMERSRHPVRPLFEGRWQ